QRRTMLTIVRYYRLKAVYSLKNLDKSENLCVNIAHDDRKTAVQGFRETYKAGMQKWMTEQSRESLLPRRSTMTVVGRLRCTSRPILLRQSSSRGTVRESRSGAGSSRPPTYRPR